jgi:mono/diheme cytochrome c family protein
MRRTTRGLGALGCALLTLGCGAPPEGLPSGPPTLDQVLLGRHLLLARDCATCHGGAGPDRKGWLSGRPAEEEAYVSFGFRAWAKNLTPDSTTGIGRYSDRQLFNALRYGLRPGATPDLEVTSATPGAGGHPPSPDYLSPAMPWASWRHMSDEELWAVIAYLRFGVEPVENPIPEHESPPDLWASWSSEERIGPYPVAPFPTAREHLAEGADRGSVLRGRRLVASLACSDCHGGRGNPAAEGWLAGAMDAEGRPHATIFEQVLEVGPFNSYPRNLTPHNTMGLGRFSERQIFNALRYGLRPGETADVEITSSVRGEGNHPLHAKYLTPSMPWAAWRHLADEDLWAIAAYLKGGVRPVANRVPDSEGPPDFWVSLFTPANFGEYPAPPFPSARERSIW